MIIKKIFFLIIILSFAFLGITTVNAESAKFYEAEYIDNIYMSRYQYSNNTIYYQKARFFRKADTNEFVYCIEPFSFFNENGTYETTLNPYNLSDAQKQRIERIAHFGYGYKNHTDIKWYAITQMMIWQEADPSAGKFFFTDTLNGNKIYPYDNEINEINNLVNQYDVLPTFNNQKYSITTSETLTLDGGEILKYYSSNDNRVQVNNTKLTINSLEEGEYEFNLYRNDNTYNKPIIFYQSYNSQNLINTGDLETINCKLYVNSYKTSITINKLDEDSKSNIPQGDANLDGAIIKIFDSNMQELIESEIKNTHTIIENLKFGKYFIQEIKPGTGYLLNDTINEIEITADNPTPTLELYNKVIKKRLTIHKTYGNNINSKVEPNIDFDIYHNNKLLETISTDDNGNAYITLPYGHYILKQRNSTPGYYKITPFEIQVEDIEDTEIKLIDYQIPVPNTHTNFILHLIKIIYHIIVILV